MKKWVKMRKTLLNELIADELYAYLEDQVRACGNYNGKVTHELVLAIVGSYGFVLLRNQKMLVKCEDCGVDGIFKLVDRKDEELKPVSTDELVEQGFDINKVDFEDLSRDKQSLI